MLKFGRLFFKKKETSNNPTINKKIGSMSSEELQELADRLAESSHDSAQRREILSENLPLITKKYRSSRYESHGGGMLSG